MVARNKILEVYIGPVSGGGFPAQLQQILYVTSEKSKAFFDETENKSSFYIPDLCMGTSGGNISLYISISGGWTEGGIKRVIKSMSPEMFSQTWWPGPLSIIPTWVLGIFEGAVYKPGYGAENLLKAFNNTESIQEIEMWNTAFNKDQKRTGLFCNKSSKNSFISPFTYSSFDFKTMPLKFFDGDISKISRSVIASASIPYLFKPVEIDNEMYIDGGVSYPSPLTPLQEEIYNCVNQITEPLNYAVSESAYPIPTPTPEQEQALFNKRDREILHMTYFSPYNIDDTSNTTETTSTLGNGSVISNVTDASCVKDRYTGINLLLRLKDSNQNVNVVDSRSGLYSLSDLFKLYNDTHYFCEIYVRTNEWIDLNNFTSQDIFNKMDEAKDNIEFLFFYVS
jgi:predicted acylesterase/phospholipase RssA